TPGLAPAAIPAPDQHRAEVGRLLTERPAAAAAPRLPAAMRPLAGLRVVELGQYTTAPLCARLLAHLGAEVIKVEQPGGDHSRTWVPQIDGNSVSFRFHNSDKKSLVLDLKSAAGVEALTRLLKTADVIVENFKPGTL